MGNWLRWGSPNQDDELKDVEKLLQSALQPIPPRPGYVKGLHWRLTYDPQPELAPVEVLNRENLWIVVLGVMSGFVLLALGIRVIRQVLR